MTIDRSQLDPMVLELLTATVHRDPNLMSTLSRRLAENNPRALRSVASLVGIVLELLDQAEEMARCDACTAENIWTAFCLDAAVARTHATGRSA